MNFYKERDKAVKLAGYEYPKPTRVEYLLYKIINLLEKIEAKIQTSSEQEKEQE